MFADYTYVDADEIERYRTGELLAPDGDGRFDGRDLSRLCVLRGMDDPVGLYRVLTD